MLRLSDKVKIIQIVSSITISRAFNTYSITTNKMSQSDIDSELNVCNELSKLKYLGKLHMVCIYIIKKTTIEHDFKRLINILNELNYFSYSILNEDI